MAFFMPDIARTWQREMDGMFPNSEDVLIKVTKIETSDTKAVVFLSAENTSDMVLSYLSLELELYDKDGVFLGEMRKDLESHVRIDVFENISLEFDKPWFIERWIEINSCKAKVVQIGGFGTSKKKS